MKRLHYSTVINAAPETVWNTMFAPDTYRAWTAAFMEGSHYEGSWAKGERIRFLAPDGNGMTAIIEDNRPYEFLSIKHLGTIEDGVEDTESDEVRSWAPLFENYTFSKSGPATELRIDIDVLPEYEGMMNETWPKALAALKALSEFRAAA